MTRRTAGAARKPCPSPSNRKEAIAMLPDTTPQALPAEIPPFEQDRPAAPAPDPLQDAGPPASLTTSPPGLQGDTSVETRDGKVRIRDLAGKTVEVLCQDGHYRAAEFKACGRQPLMEVEFTDGQTFRASAQHEWVALNCCRSPVRVPTRKLRKHYRVVRAVASRPPRDADFEEGVRHGFTFGDGTSYYDGKRTRAEFHGAKAPALLPYFSGQGNEPCRAKDNTDLVRISGLPEHYKQLPADASGASYWYGFVCGFFAADGTVNAQNGCCILCQSDEAALQAIAAQLPRIGMMPGPVRGYDYCTMTPARGDGEPPQYEGRTHQLTLLKRFMTADDLLRPTHKENFERSARARQHGLSVGVAAIRETGIVDEVYAGYEPETRTFAIGNAVPTGSL
jgi:ribonucleoside-diphosphate reductase alpha chain